MKEYILKITLCFIFFFYCNANASVKYTYNKNNGEIIAESESKTHSISFKGFSKSNFNGWVEFLDDKPVIVYDNNSMMNYSTFVLLKYEDSSFMIDCIYLDIRSGFNGVYAKEGVCGLGKPISGDFSKYEEYVYSIVNKYLDKVNSIDTTYYREMWVNKLPIILMRNKEHYIYKFYASKEDLLNGEYIIRECSGSDRCKDYKQQPWIITDMADTSKITILQDQVVNERHSFIPATSSPAVEKNEFMPFTISAERAFFYSDDHQKRKAYLIKNDRVNLINMTEDKVWCRVQYLNTSNKSSEGNISCEELNK